MVRNLFVAVALLLGLATSPPANSEPRLVASGNDLGLVRVAKPAGPAKALVFLYSDRAGWNPELDAASERLAADGIAVVGIDLPAYVDRVAGTDETDCHYLVSAIEDLSKRLQREIDASGYRSPILAGVGEGGMLAYAALAQAPAATVEGAISVDSAPTLRTSLPICKGAPYESRGAAGFAYGRRDALPGWWRVATRASAPADPFPFVAEVPAGERVALPADADLTTALVESIEPAVEDIEQPDSDALADLPIVPIAPVGTSTGLLAVILSGDGGWRDIDKQIGEWLAQHGVGVVGLDSLRYFWTEKPPEQIARDLLRIIDRYGREFHAERTILVGYSFGADVLPATWHAMPPSERKDVAQISLLGLSPTADFEFHVGGWLGLSEGSRPVAPDARTLDPKLVQCFYGAEESDSFCRDPLFAKVERIETKGGHHFDGDYAALAKRILDGAQRRMVTGTP